MGKILGMNLTNEDDSVINVSGALHVKTPAALETLLRELKAIGYKIDNLRDDEHRKSNGVDIETMEKNGWSLWFAKLDVRRGKCNSCKGIISTLGIRSHGHTCELCGAVTYYDMIDGSTVRFSFIERERERGGMADITMKVKRWDTEEGHLYFYPDILEGLWLKGDRAKQYFEEHKDKWEEVDENGEKLIRVAYPRPWNYDVSAINPSDINGHFWNHQIVRVWEGKEYPEYLGGFPLQDTISIYESWHHPRYPRSPTLHTTILLATGQTDDKGWHYQDGRPWFQPGHWKNMSTFIRHFTELDADAFDKAWPHFRSDGPGGIDDLAKFCHKDAQVRNEPNIGNLIVGVSKVVSGQPLVKDEIVAMSDALADREIRGDFMGVLKARS